MATLTTVRTVAEFNAAFDRLSAAESGRPFLMLFTGAPDAATGESWCGDCRVADPVLHAAFAAADPSVQVIVAPVERPEWRPPAGAPPHPFRARFQLKGVPTLMAWGKGRSRGSLLEAQCADKDLVNELVNDTD
jgi:hypothetical protein